MERLNHARSRNSKDSSLRCGVIGARGQRRSIKFAIRAQNQGGRTRAFVAARSYAELMKSMKISHLAYLKNSSTAATRDRDPGTVSARIRGSIKVPVRAFHQSLW